MMPANRLLNSAITAMYGREYSRFLRATDLEKVQSAYLSDLLRKNADTVFGREQGFADIHSYEEYAKHVPILTYEDYRPYIDRIAQGETCVLTAEPVRLLEPTSGSSDGRKLIPYTETLRKEFRRGIQPWLCDLYRRVPGTADGKSYWSVTPVTSRKEYSTGGIPIGFEEDAEYFGAMERHLMRGIFAVDSSVKFVSDMDEFYRRTCEQLLCCEKLSLISVWNPTYLTILCDYIASHRDSLAHAIPERRRRDVLDAIGKGRFDLVFPHLAVISLWADGSAADYDGRVAERFPGVRIQAKGLLATECFVSFPLTGEEGSRLSIYSHFFEFLCLTDGKIYRAHELKTGEYEIIVTTGGGLYRYRIGDVVDILETYANRPPRLRFLRRAGVTSDHFGEKLTEEFVKKVASRLAISDTFYLIAPEENTYVLFTNTENIDEERLDRELCENFHYNYCRSLGQLARARVVRVNGSPEEAYIKRLVADGMRLGDIKPSHLSNRSGWTTWFMKGNNKL